MVIGCGSADHWHFDPDFDVYAACLTRLFVKEGIPIWNDRPDWESIVSGFRTRIPEGYNEVTDCFQHFQLPDSEALPSLRKRTLRRCLNWIGANYPDGGRLPKVARYAQCGATGLMGSAEAGVDDAVTDVAAGALDELAQGTQELEA